MAYPAEYFSDEDDFNGFITDESDDDYESARIPDHILGEPQQFNRDRELNNFYFAIMNGSVRDVQDILSNDIHVDVILKDNWTPLMLAASVGNSDITSELISRGANVNADRDKYTVLMAACNCPKTTSPPVKCLDVVTQLLVNGADFNAKTYTKKTALMFAASNGNLEIVAKLLDAGADLYAEDNQGWHALFWAVSDNNAEVVRFLVDRGVNVNKVDIRNNRPLDYVTSEQQEEIIGMLSDEDEKETETVPQMYYNREQLFTNRDELERGAMFLEDVQGILQGLECKHLSKKFVDVGLKHFLCLTDEELVKLEIPLPYQRRRILTGLFDFHKHGYKPKSLFVMPTGTTCSTIDISNALMMIIRQIIVAEASLKYIRGNLARTNENLDFTRNVTKNVCYKLKELKKTGTALYLSSKMWDSTVYTPDLISGPRKRTSRWVKLLTVASITSLSVLIVCKKGLL